MSETYRHELKYTVDWGTYCSLRQRLKTVLKPDSHAGPNGCYHIHSIYFDNPDDKALREKINGVALREAFRAADGAGVPCAGRGGGQLFAAQLRCAERCAV